MRGVDAAIHVRNQFPREIIDAGKVGGWPAAQVRQFPAEPAREMPASHPNLFFNQIKIIQQPFRRWSDAANFFNLQSLFIVVAKQFFVGGESWQEAIRTFPGSDLMALRKLTRMALEQINTEQFAPKGLFADFHMELT
jgi:hypothetical protein